MKPFYIFLAIATLLVSCNHKDGAIEHHQRLHTVYAQSLILQDATTYSETPNHKVQEWQWDGKLPYRIDYIEDEHTYSENLYFDNRNRLSSTTIPVYGYRTQFTYNKRELECIEVFQNDVLLYTLTFSHIKKHISSIHQEFAPGGTKAKLNHSPLDLLCDPSVAQFVTSVGNQPKSKGNTAVDYNLVWENDNLIQFTAHLSDTTYTMTFTYDNYRNPIRDCYTYFEMEDHEAGIDALQDGLLNPFMISKNNILTCTRNFKNNPEFTFYYSYQYEGKYPISQKLTYEYTSLNTVTIQDCIMKVEETRTFDYLD